MNAALEATRSQAAFTQPLTSTLIAQAGVRPGMRAIVLGGGASDLAFLVGERVGPGGWVVALEADRCAVESGRRAAKRQRFDHVFFSADPAGRDEVTEPVDVVIGRFSLMRDPDPVATIRRAAAWLRPGGRLILQEWHFESMTWAHASAYPGVPLYGRFRDWTLEALRRENVHTDMGLRLSSAFVEAGLPSPQVELSLLSVDRSLPAGFGYFAETLAALLPTIEREGLASSGDVDVATFAARLEREAAPNGHVFLPLQVGAWARTRMN